MSNLTYPANILYRLAILFFISSDAYGQTSLLEMRKNQIKEVLQSDTPVLTIKSGKSKADTLQQIFIRDPRLKIFYVTREEEKMLNEIFGIFPVRPSDITPATQMCRDGSCARIEMYNYALNETIIGFLHIPTLSVVAIGNYKQMQPDIPAHLVDLAIEIAKSDPLVQKELTEYGMNPEPLMPGTKTALNRTSCQRSQHLCVAPTFIKGTKALWVITDLTSLKVAGTQWTNTGDGDYVSERSAQNKKIMDCFCEKETNVNLLGWNFDYTMTRSDGLRVSDVTYKGVRVLESVKLVDWHVSYSKVEGFGYADAVGCPEYSTAAVHAIESPEIQFITSGTDTMGFRIVQEYFSQGWPSPCNYNYYQHYEFYRDGSFRPVAGSVGRGCGNNGIYRPVTRIAMDREFGLAEQWAGQWKKWLSEGWTLQTDTTSYHDDGVWFRFSGESPPIHCELTANYGQFGDGGRGDNAYIYLTAAHSDRFEGDSDLPAIGSCCNLDHRQGPEQFIDQIPEKLGDTGMVLWYVPQLYNDNTPGNEYCWAEMRMTNGVLQPVRYPCLSGPKFKFTVHE